MRSEVQVLLDPPSPFGALAQLVERLLCKQDVIGSNPIGSTRTHSLTRHDQKAMRCFLVLSDARTAWPCILHRSERIIGVVGCNQVGLQRLSVPSGKQPTMTLSKSSTLTKMVSSCMGIDQKVFSRWKRRETYMLLIGSDPCETQKAQGDGPFGSFFFRIKSSAIRAFGGCLGSKRR